MNRLNDLLKEEASRLRKPALQEAIERALQTDVQRALHERGKPVDLAKIFDKNR